MWYCMIIWLIPIPINNIFFMLCMRYATLFCFVFFCSAKTARRVMDGWMETETESEGGEKVNELVSEWMSDSFIFTICDPSDFDCPQHKNSCIFIIEEELRPHSVILFFWNKFTGSANKQTYNVLKSKIRIKDKSNSSSVGMMNSVINMRKTSNQNFKCKYVRCHLLCMSACVRACKWNHRCCE